MQDDEDLGSAIDSALEAAASGGLRNYVFALWRPDRPMLVRAGGNLAPDSVVWIASASKAVAATVMLTLVDDGLLDLDAPVSRYIGRSVSWPADKAAVTARMLLNHTAGFTPSPTEWEPDMISLRGCVQDIAKLPLVSPPGTRFFYGSGGYQVAGLVAEAITGKEWCDLVAERVTGPANTRGLQFLRQRNPLIGAAGLSTAQDYLRYMSLYLTGGRVSSCQVLSRKMVAMALQTQTAHATDFWYSAAGQSWSGYSFGWWHGAVGQWPNAGQEFSGLGIFGTLPWFDVDNRYAAVVITSDGSDASVAAWPSLRRTILNDLHGTGHKQERQGAVPVALPAI